MRLVMLLTLIALVGCEIRPLGYEARLRAAARRHVAKHYKPRHAPQHLRPVETVTVTPEWLSHYKALEEVHGNYTIPEDANTHVMPDGKVAVPHGVVQHYNDLIRAKIPESPPPLIEVTPSP